MTRRRDALPSFGDISGASQFPGAFPFFDQQGATLFMGLASWFASSKKTARMTYRSLHPRVREKFQPAVWEN
jgi:hypothetical protein